ncbi:uncharacterized protein LOC144453032 [Glandiceps talaboti]
MVTFCEYSECERKMSSVNTIHIFLFGLMLLAVSVESLICHNCDSVSCGDSLASTLRLDCSAIPQFPDARCQTTKTTNPAGEIVGFTRSCFDASFCVDGCFPLEGNTTCQSCCSTDLCNDELADGSEGGGDTDQGGSDGDIRCYTCQGGGDGCRTNLNTALSMDCSIIGFDQPACAVSGQTNADGEIEQFGRSCIDASICFNGCIQSPETGGTNCVSCCESSLCNTDELKQLGGIADGDDDEEGGDDDEEGGDDEEEGGDDDEEVDGDDDDGDDGTDGGNTGGDADDSKGVGGSAVIKIGLYTCIAYFLVTLVSIM